MNKSCLMYSITLSLKSDWGNFAMQRIEQIVDIYPVFRKLFQKQSE
jgi:uncharacterized sporulation protein YeaH/YhbH (DUF444 family)